MVVMLKNSNYPHSLCKTNKPLSHFYLLTKHNALQKVNTSLIGKVNEKSGAQASGGAGVSCECRQGGMCRGELRILLFSIFGAITAMFSISAADVSLFFSGVFVPHSSTH
jgi:hypothetical protein